MSGQPPTFPSRRVRRYLRARGETTLLTAAPSFPWPGPRQPHKYAAQAVVVDGHRFPSQAEARRYGQLQQLVKAGIVSGLVLQPKFELHALGGERIGRYIADFAYQHLNEGYVVEDVKGMDLPLGRWKRKHCEAEYGVTVTVIRRR